MGEQTAARGSGGSGARHRARRLAMQALYQWLISETEIDDLMQQFAADTGMRRADRAYFDALVRGTLERAEEIRALFDSFLDRPVVQIDPVEHAILLVTGFELMQRPEVPYRVILNEGIELAKVYGASESHRYINGILDRVAHKVRPVESRA